MIDAYQLLVDAKRLIDTPEKWTTEEFARNDAGDPVNYDSKSACRFCSLGALGRAVAMNLETPTGVRDTAAVILAEYMGFQVAKFNDNHTHAEVMAAWDKAIESIAKQEVAE